MFAPFIYGAIVYSLQVPNVTLELRGVRMENAAPILAKALGMSSLEIGPSLKNDVILVRTKDVAPEVLKANLAKVLNGTWEHRTEGWRFTQSDEQKAQERKTYDKARYKFFSEIVEKSKKRLAGMQPFDEENSKKLIRELKALSTSTISDRFNNTIWRRISKIDEQSPMHRFAIRASLRITPAVWMRLTEDNPRVVFSTRPNAMQQPFPFRVDDLLDIAMQEQNQWATYAAGQPLDGPKAGPSEEDGRYSLGKLNDRREPFKASDFNIITMTVALQEQTIEFRAYNAKGKSTLDANINAYEASEEDFGGNVKDEIEKLKKKMVKATGDAKEYLDLVAPIDFRPSNAGNRKPLSPSLLAKLLNPEKVDPLSIGAPDVYLGSIDTPNVIISMNDNQRQMRFPEFKDSRYMRFMPANIVDADGWFMLSQPNPMAVRKLMPDRKILGPLLRFINANKRPLSLEEQATFALQLPWSSEFRDSYQAHLRLVETSEIETYNNRSALRIFGSMTTGQVAQAKKGGVPFSSLTDDAKREIFRSIFYSQRYESQVDMDWQAQGNMTPAESKEFNSMQELLWGGIYEEKTFVLPTGLTNNLLLTIEDNTVSQLYCSRPKDDSPEVYYGQGRPMTSSQLGGYLFKSTNPQRYRWEVGQYNKIDENNIRMASQRSMTIKMKISKLMYFRWNLSQTLITDPTVYTSKTLPKAMLDEIKKGYDEAEKYDKEYGQNYGGRTRTINPPPI